MLHLHKIELSNFRSYQGAHSFEFPEKSGLYFFTGQNKADAIGANGAGKSTFLDAIVWCLYGRTTRGLKSNDILTWGSTKTAAVTLELTVGYRFKVKRTQRPNGLYLDDKPIDQDELQKHLRLNFDSFLHSVLNAQFGTSFFSLKPSDKLTLFSNIMELDFWLDKAQATADASATLETQINVTENLMAKFKERRNIFELSIQEMNDLSDIFSKKNKAEISEIEKALRLLNGCAVSSEIEIDELRVKKAKALAGLKDLLIKMKHTESRRDHLLSRVQKYASSIVDRKRRLDEHKKQLKEFMSMGGRCLCCDRDIAPEYAKSHSSGILMNIDVASEGLDLDEQNKEFSFKALVQTKGALEKQGANAQQMRDQISNLDIEITKQESARAEAARRETELKSTLVKKRNETNPYAKMIEEKETALRSTIVQLRDAKKKLAELDAQHQAVSYWIKGFKRVRLFIIEQTFQTLELEVNNSLAQLGLPDWQITFDIERENKSGGITKGFVVFVKSPKNKEPVKWENWSGGETQRLELAGDLGLANLICQQAGLDSRIEFYDEPSTHLSQEGMLDLANMLHERAISENKTIWIVDHAAITNFGDFEGIIVARKDGSGSTIDYH